MELFENYLSALPKKKRLSKVKLIILKRLWVSDDFDFPKPWVPSTELLELTGQKYFDRRTRELRDELGCDLESSYIPEFSGHAWRLKSSMIAPPMEREYLTESQRSSLFSNCSNTCATCGKTVAAGVRGLQADHKIPLSRGGGNELTNWQALCHNCNRRYLTSTTNNRHVATKPKLNSTSSVPIFLIHLFSAECVCYLQRTQCILRTKNHVNR